MSGFKVFIPEPFPREACALIEDVAEVVQGTATRAYSEDELVRAVAEVDGLIITSRDRITERVIAAAPRLRVITKSGARPVNVDVEAAGRRGVAVTWTPGANSVSVAEHALGLMLAVGKRVLEMSARLRAGGWRDFSTLGLELTGKTIGLVGFGSVGMALHRLVQGFDVRVLVHDPFVAAATIEKAGAVVSDLDGLLAAADVVSLHCELSDATRHLIGARELRRMRPASILINTARGAIVDEAALHEALRDGRLAGAGLDVFETEPVACNPLLALPNVVATPHTAAFTREAILRETTWAVEDARAILLGRPPVHWRANP